ncbi:transcriptional regulator [Chromobacterium sp.]|uniref:transcriptional regulator n=1 Tax=Chromobacterium sp. TaxID=306190 RepID=UPI0035B1F813
MSSFAVIPQPREIRLKLGLNQQEFWGRVGVTQSGGSRYESGRNMPKAVRELVRLVYIEQIDLATVTRYEIEMIALLKENQPELYESLRKTVQARMAAVKTAEQPT